MTFNVDDAFLQKLRLGGLLATEKNAMSRHIYEILEMRVGMALEEQMTSAQLDQFEAFIDGGDEAGALLWPSENLPAYKDVVRVKFEELKVEIRKSASAILAASGRDVDANT